jgi:hypothetical protein
MLKEQHISRLMSVVNMCVVGYSKKKRDVWVHRELTYTLHVILRKNNDYFSTQNLPVKKGGLLKVTDFSVSIL